VVANPVISHAAFCLAHTPELVRYGSKPRREIAKNPEIEARISSSLRSYAKASSYAPNQTFIGSISPDELANRSRPWHSEVGDRTSISSRGPFGEIISEGLFLAILKQADVLEPALVELGESFAARAAESASRCSALARLVKRDWRPLPHEMLSKELGGFDSLPLYVDGALAGLVRRDNRAEGAEDENLAAGLLLESLCTKATASIVLGSLLERQHVAPESITFIISCGEEAAGDRYQRGGGGVAKAVGEMCGCTNASGMDIKNFCAAPASALIAASALVAAGLHERVAVVAGGSLAKLGMKFEGFLRSGVPILDDCLAAHAFIVERDDGVSPIIHIEPGSVGIASIGSSAADEAVYRQLITEPLAALGLTMSDIDKYAPELHNPEIMQHAGSGDVAHKNYRMIAAMAVRSGAIRKPEMEAFVGRVGMVGFAPTQGHIPSGVAYIGHALRELRAGAARRIMILSKASLFLNRLTELYDGVSFVLEANPRSKRNSEEG